MKTDPTRLKIVVASLFDEMTLYDTTLRKVTAYISDKFVVRLTRQFKYNKRNTRETLLLTYGRPNYEERAYIALLKKAKEPFPVKKIQLKFWPKPRAKKGKK